MKSDSTTVIKNMEFLVKELHKEWDRSGASKAVYRITKAAGSGEAYGVSRHGAGADAAELSDLLQDLSDGGKPPKDRSCASGDRCARRADP